MKGFYEQTNFTGGIWSPLLDGRTDLAKYGNSVKRLENMIVWPQGAAQNRPGLRYIAGTKTNAKLSRLINFEFSVTQAYILEFGDQYIRFYKDQAQITSGGSPYEISSPYLEADLAAIKFCQSADVLYLFHPGYATRKLSRTAHTAWTLSTINWRSQPISEQALLPAATLTLGAVSGSAVTFTAGSGVFLSGDVGRLITSGAGRASITSFNSTSQVVCDIIDAFAAVGPIASQSWRLLGSPNSGLTPTVKEPVGAICTLTSVGGSETFVNMVADSDQDYWTVSASGTTEYYQNNTASMYSATKPDKIYIDGIEATEGALGSLGILQWAHGDNDALGYNTVYVRLSDGADPDDKSSSLSPDPDFIKRSTVATTSNLFRAADVGKYIRIHSGLVKITTYTSATEVKGEILKTLSATTESTSWTLESEMWNSTNGYPSCGTFYEERLIVAGSTANPETIWGSAVGDYENHAPGTDDADAFQFSLAGQKVTVIRWIEPREYLMIGTAGGEWRLGPEDTGSPLTPLNVIAKEVTTKGCANKMALAVDSATLFIQRAETKIRELAYDLQKGEQGGYVAPDMTILVEHLMTDGIAGMSYQQEPIPTIWAYTTTGELLSMTYLRAEEVIAWHQHPMSGIIESLAVIPGDGYDELWAVVKRTVNGGTVRYVEMMESVFRDSAATYITNKGLNAFFVDSGLTYNGASTTTISGLGHLESEEVTILADGNTHPARTVTSGAITLSKAATVVHVGLGFTSTIETQRFAANVSDGTSQGRKKRIIDLVVRVNDSGTFKVGRDESNLDTKYDPERALVLGAPYALFTGDIRTGFEGGYDREGRLFIVQDKPMPLTVISIYPEVEVP